MSAKPKFHQGEFSIVEGVRYKSGSVKIIEQNNEFFVVYKRPIFWKILLEHEILRFSTLEQAQIKYEQLKAKLWQMAHS